MADKLWIGQDGNYAEAANWSPSGVPVNSDNVRLTSAGGSITTGLNQSSVTLGDFIVERSFSGSIGSATGYLQIACGVFIFEGLGPAFINLGSSAIGVEVRGTGAASAGEYGLNLLGSALTLLNVLRGSVGVATLLGQTSTVGNVRLASSSSRVGLGPGVTLSTAASVINGSLESSATIPTITLDGGQATLLRAAASTTVNARGGTLIHSSTGTLATINASGGTVDWTRSGAARTVTTINWTGGTLLLNVGPVTYTNGITPAGVLRASAS
jgi:hypothetical protein